MFLFGFSTISLIIVNVRFLLTTKIFRWKWQSKDVFIFFFQWLRWWSNFSFCFCRCLKYIYYLYWQKLMTTKVVNFWKCCGCNRLHFLKGLFHLCLLRSTMPIQPFLVQRKQSNLSLFFYHREKKNDSFFILSNWPFI